MKYETYPVAKDLQGFVKCYWTLRGLDSINEKQVVVPDGCMEMIFHFGDLYLQYLNDSESILQPRCFVIGQLTEPLVIEPTGKTDIFSVRFHPHGFTPFSNLPIKKFENNAVALSEVFKHDGKNLEEKILKCRNTSERISIVEKLLIDKVSSNSAVDQIVQTTIDTILQVNGNYSVKELSNQTAIHRRQLERKFATKVGLSPKYLSRIIRMQSVLKGLLTDNYDSLTSLGYEEGYYDQSHFIKDFKYFTGKTPREFFGDKLKLSALFYGKE